MALISGKTILTSLSLFHITLGFFFLTNPATIADQTLVYLIGEAMGMPEASTFDAKSPALAFLGVVLATLGLSDLVSLSLPEEICLVHHWGTQGTFVPPFPPCSLPCASSLQRPPLTAMLTAPFRFFVSLVLVFYTFFFSAASPLYADPSRSRFAHPSAHTPNPRYSPSGWGGDALKNRVFFAFVFVELVSWFWVWVTLREEQREILTRKARRRSSQSYVR